MRLLIATKNKGKLAEFKRLLSDLPLDLTGLDALPSLPDAVEDGDTFAANAEKKAVYYAAAFRMWTIADDSGLEVSAIGGRPGVYSARFAGEHAGDEDNITKLLSILKEIPQQERDAQFTAVVALVSPDGQEKFFAAGSCKGLIITKPQGKNGFGYDPIFYLPEKKKTMAELSMAEKNILSHRAAAVLNIKPVLRKIVAMNQ